MVIAPAVIMSKGVRRFTDLRAWQACRNYKLAVYRMVLDTPLNRDWKRREQLEKSVAVDKGYLTEAARAELNALCVIALQEVTGWMEYLQSEEALRNARRARERRIATRATRRSPKEPPD